MQHTKFKFHIFTSPVGSRDSNTIRARMFIHSEKTYLGEEEKH